MWQEILNWSSTGGLYLLALLLFAAGYLGAVLPYPGCFVTLLGCATLVCIGGEPYPEWWFWGLQIALAIFGTLVDNLTTAMGARKFGGSKAAFWFAMLGLIVGAFFVFPFGIVLGPFIGALIAELAIARRDIKDAAKAGLGAASGLLVGVVCKLIISTIMLILCIFR